MERAKLRPLEDHRLNALLRERLHSWQEADAIPRLLRRSRGPARPEAIAADPEAAEWLALPHLRRPRATTPTDASRPRDHPGGAQALPRRPEPLRPKGPASRMPLAPLLGGF